MSVSVSKAVAYGVTGTATGQKVSKVVAYVLLVPGTEAGATPPAYHVNSYAQILPKPNPKGAL